MLFIQEIVKLNILDLNQATEYLNIQVFRKTRQKFLITIFFIAKTTWQTVV